MRIIAGTARGCLLASPKNKARPTLDMVKESLFNIISPSLINASFLDIFAGSGAIGLEALSRGAKNAVFVDIDVTTIRRNVEKTKMFEKSEILKMDYTKAARNLSINKRQFDFIFADPPYDFNFTEMLTSSIIKNSLLKDTGIFILECIKNKPIFKPTNELNLIRIKEYSNCILYFMELAKPL